MGDLGVLMDEEFGRWEWIKFNDSRIFQKGSSFEKTGRKTKGCWSYFIQSPSPPLLGQDFLYKFHREAGFRWQQMQRIKRNVMHTQRRGIQWL